MPAYNITFYTILYHSNSGILELKFFTLWFLSINLFLKMSNNTLMHQVAAAGVDSIFACQSHLSND